MHDFDVICFNQLSTIFLFQLSFKVFFILKGLGIYLIDEYFPDNDGMEVAA